MVWPFAPSPSSTTALEKTLSTLTTKITAASTKDARLRSTSRRACALWTLYTSFVYTTYSLILLLVTGYQRWGLAEYAAVVGGPLVIWGVRLLISGVMGWRISRNGRGLEDLRKQKGEAVRKYKEATRYDETERVLEKYGGEVKKVPEEESEAAQRNEKGGKSRRQSQAPQQQVRRTNLPPPPTANIQRPSPPRPLPQAQPPSQPSSPQQPTSPHHPPTRRDSTASFAPNALDEPTQIQYAAPTSRQWYDRLMDVLLGEDETKPINRVALICRHCKLVNGQAPPGAKEVGRWRCMGCKGWNGEDEVAAIIEEKEAEVAEKKGVEMEEKKTAKGKDESDTAAVEEDAPLAKSTRSSKKSESDET